MKAVICATVDDLGYLFCAQCRQIDERGRWMDGRTPYAVVYSDAGPHNAEACEGCGESCIKHAVAA